MRTMRVTVAAAVVAALLVVVASGFGIAGGSDYVSLGLMALVVLSSAGVGALIGVRVPGHRVGLVLALAGLVYGTSFLAEAYARFTLLEDRRDLAGGDYAALWANASWAAFFGALIAIAFLFPDGNLPSPRWRPFAWLASVSVAGVVVMGLFTDEKFDKPFDAVDNPLPARPGFLAPLELLFLLGLLVSVVAAGVAARKRFKAAQQPERQQLLWLAASAWLIPVTLVVCFLDIVVPGSLDVLIWLLLLVTVTAVPASIGIAVLRYRLYELDRLVNRTLVYGALTALVFAAYYLAVVVIGRAINDQESLVVTLAATAIVVVAVNPVRVRLQRRVDRLMYGDRADPYAGLSRLAERLESSVTPQMALRTIVETVADSLRVPFVSVDLEGGGGLQRAAAVGGDEPAGAVREPLSFQGESVGVLVVGPRAGEDLAPADRRLLGELARHAGAVVHATRLTRELQASRERLVAAQEEVRRRLRRDLHDDLGPALASAVFQVDLARDELPAEATEVDSRLAQLRTQLQDAVTGIRDLAYSLRPPALEEGLVPAIEHQVSALNARGAGPVVTLAAPPSLPELSPAVEAAAYRIVMEAVGNAAKHSGARTCEIRLHLNGGLQVEVADDGRHQAPFRPGVGITSMRERASELGATLAIEQLPTGTRVHTVLPVGDG